MTQKDFEELEYNPIVLKEGELMQKKYKYFAKRDVFSVPLKDIPISEEDEEKYKEVEKDDEFVLSDLLKFIVLFIDQDSPFYDFDDFDERTEACLSWAKIDNDSRALFHITNQSEWYLNLEAHYFLHVVDNAKFEDYYSKKRAAMSMKRFLRTPIESSDNPENTVKAILLISQSINKETDALMQLQAEVFPKNSRLQKRLKKQIDNIEANRERMTSYAESKAKPVPR